MPTQFASVYSCTVFCEQSRELAELQAAGSSNAIKMAMIAITTSNSIRVKPRVQIFIRNPPNNQQKKRYDERNETTTSLSLVDKFLRSLCKASSQQKFLAIQSATSTSIYLNRDR